MSAKPDPAAIWDVIFKVVAVIILPWVVWATVSIFQFRSFIARGDRFSATDGHKLHTTILEESSKLRQSIFELESEFSAGYVRHSELKQVLEARDRKRE